MDRLRELMNAWIHILGDAQSAHRDNIRSQIERLMLASEILEATAVEQTHEDEYDLYFFRLSRFQGTLTVVRETWKRSEQTKMI